MYKNVREASSGPWLSSNNFFLDGGGAKSIVILFFLSFSDKIFGEGESLLTEGADCFTGKKESQDPGL